MKDPEKTLRKPQRFMVNGETASDAEQPSPPEVKNAKATAL
jgi:hypothetical protein